MGDEAMIQRGYVKIRKMRNWRNLGGLEYPVGLFQIFFFYVLPLWVGQVRLTWPLGKGFLVCKLSYQPFKSNISWQAYYNLLIIT